MTGTSANERRQITEKPEPDRRPDTVFPPYDDPAFSKKAADTAAGSSRRTDPPKDTQYAGHPEFSQDAALDEPVVFDAEDQLDEPSRPDAKK